MWAKGLVEDRFSLGANIIVTTENCNAYNGLLLTIDDDCITIIQHSVNGTSIMYTDIQLVDIESISLLEPVGSIDTLKNIANEESEHNEENEGDIESASS